VKKICYRIIIIASTCIIYIALSLSPIFFKNIPNTNPNPEYKIIAHRGASSLAPENTKAAIVKALKLKPHRIEVDIQQTKDSTVVLMHDITLNRTTDGEGLIKEKTYIELSKLDAGSWFSKAFAGEEIPKLETIIQLINGKCELIIEIKKGHDFYPNIEKHILKLIKKYNAEDWIIIHSFDDNVLKTIHELNPNIALHKLFVGKLKFTPFIVSNTIDRLDLERYNYIKEYSINYAFANKAVIKHLKSHGKKVNVWTVNNPKTAEALIGLGVDGIITNNPELLHK
jgi:glycerophosphoryl diester phosphodiesterase